MYHSEVVFLYSETLCWAGFYAQPSGAVQFLSASWKHLTFLAMECTKGPKSTTNLLHTMPTIMRIIFMAAFNL